MSRTPATPSPEQLAALVTRIDSLDSLKRYTLGDVPDDVWELLHDIRKSLAPLPVRGCEGQHEWDPRTVSYSGHADIMAVTCAVCGLSGAFSLPVDGMVIQGA